MRVSGYQTKGFDFQESFPGSLCILKIHTWLQFKNVEYGAEMSTLRSKDALNCWILKNQTARVPEWPYGHSRTLLTSMWMTGDFWSGMMEVGNTTLERMLLYRRWSSVLFGVRLFLNKSWKDGMLFVLYSTECRINIPVRWPRGPWDNPVWSLFDHDSNTPASPPLGTSAL